MNTYRVLIKQIEYRNTYIKAETEAEAERKAIEGDWIDSRFMDGTDAEVITVDPLGKDAE